MLVSSQFYDSLSARKGCVSDASKFALCQIQGLSNADKTRLDFSFINYHAPICSTIILPVQKSDKKISTIFLQKNRDFNRSFHGLLIFSQFFLHSIFSTVCGQEVFLLPVIQNDGNNARKQHLNNAEYVCFNCCLQLNTLQQPADAPNRCTL